MCDPSLNCWTDEVIAPQPTGDNVRSAGFHIHVGYDEPNMQTNKLLAQAMDLFLGVPSILKEPKNERKAVGYGLSGNYRNQKHGMEFRSLSSYFSSNKDLVQWCFKNTERAIEFVNNGESNSISSLGNTIQEVINGEDCATAEIICKDFGIQI